MLLHILEYCRFFKVTDVPVRLGFNQSDYFCLDSRAIFDTVITKCLLCLSEAQSRPYLSHRFQPDRALALLQGSLGSRAMRPVRDFLADERLSDSLSLYLSERQASSADAHSVLKVVPNIRCEYDCASKLLRVSV